MGRDARGRAQAPRSPSLVGWLGRRQTGQGVAGGVGLGLRPVSLSLCHQFNARPQAAPTPLTREDWCHHITLVPHLALPESSFPLSSLELTQFLDRDEETQRIRPFA